MSISNEALQKLVQEIETQAVQSQQQLSLVKAEISAKQRDIRLLNLTSSELSTLSHGTNIYEGVGKMFVFSDTAETAKRLKAESDQLKQDVENLGKRLHYLETTYKSSRDNIDAILMTGRPT